MPANQGGLLVIRQPWPAMLRTIYGDDERYQQQYWSQVPHCYFTADGARRDEDGYFWIMGRVDDVLNVAGHRLSTMEVESALVHHPKVAEAAVVGKPDEIKGEGIACFVTLIGGVAADGGTEEGAARARRQGDRRPGPARRDPLHRSAAEDALGQDHAPAAARHRRGRQEASDTTTLEDFSVLAKLARRRKGDPSHRDALRLPSCNGLWATLR